MKEMIEHVARMLVDDPEKVVVQEKKREDLTVFELRVDKQDLGRVIGKNGRTAHAIRSLLGILSARAGERALLEIVE